MQKRTDGVRSRPIEGSEGVHARRARFESHSLLQNTTPANEVGRSHPLAAQAANVPGGGCLSGLSVNKAS